MSLFVSVMWQDNRCIVPLHDLCGFDRVGKCGKSWYMWLLNGSFVVTACRLIATRSKPLVLWMKWGCACMMLYLCCYFVGIPLVEWDLLFQKDDCDLSDACAYYDEGDAQRPYGHALVVGIERYPLKVTKRMGQKLIAKRSHVKPFLKVVNYNHLMPTRYALDVEHKHAVNKELVRDPTQRNKSRKDVRKLLEERYV
eukprot:Opistho-2@22165